MSQEFERYPALARWIERMADNALNLSLADWRLFVGALNDALAAARQEGARGGEPVAWRVKDFADDWILFHTEAEARREAEGAGNLVQPLYASTAEPSGWARIESVAPFAEGGVGDQMCKAAGEYLDEYVLSTEGDDHEPTEFERELLQDFFNGLISDERFFGPVRKLLLPAEPSGWRPGVPEPEHLLEFIAYRPDAGVFPAQWHYPAHPDGGYDEEADPVLFTSGGTEDLTRDMPTMWHALPLPPTSEGGGA